MAKHTSTNKRLVSFGPSVAHRQQEMLHGLFNTLSDAEKGAVFQLFQSGGEPIVLAKDNPCYESLYQLELFTPEGAFKHANAQRFFMIYSVADRYRALPPDEKKTLKHFVSPSLLVRPLLPKRHPHFQALFETGFFTRKELEDGLELYVLREHFLPYITSLRNQEEYIQRKLPSQIPVLPNLLYYAPEELSDVNIVDAGDFFRKDFAPTMPGVRRRSCIMHLQIPPERTDSIIITCTRMHHAEELWEILNAKLGDDIEIAAINTRENELAEVELVGNVTHILNALYTREYRPVTVQTIFDQMSDDLRYTPSKSDDKPKDTKPVYKPVLLNRDYYIDKRTFNTAMAFAPLSVFSALGVAEAHSR